MVEPAKKQPLTEERAKTQLEKTGETPFYFKELDVCMDDNCFVPMQTLNELRRWYFSGSVLGQWRCEKY